MNFFIYKNKYILILIILLSAVFSINRIKTQNWGDDFAHYILQAKHIVQGIPQSESKIIYNKQISIGPPAYPIGFPLLIAPVFAIFGNNIEAFLFFIDINLILLGVILFYFYSYFFSKKLSFFLSLLFIFNPWMLTMKSHIMSDIPYTLFSFLAITLFLKENKKIVNYAILGVLVGFLISIRTLGISMLASFSIVLVYSIYKKIRENNSFKQELINLFILNFASFLLLAVFNFIFRMPKEGSYLDQLNFAELINAMVNNIVYYTDFIYNYFPFNLEGASQYTSFKQQFPLLSNIILFIYKPLRAFVFVAFLLGFFYKIKEKFNVVHLFSLIYLGLLMPWEFSPPRYLMPFLPLFIYFIALGFKQLTIHKYLYIFTLVFILLPTYFAGIYFLNKQATITREGPQMQQAQEAFDYIKKNVPDNSVVVFRKPRALALYTNKTTIINKLDLNYKILEENFGKKTNNLYFLLDNAYFGKIEISKVQEKYGSDIQLIWHNKRFYLLKR